MNSGAVQIKNIIKKAKDTGTKIFYTATTGSTKYQSKNLAWLYVLHIVVWITEATQKN